jgi:chemotaxis protein MotB
MADEGKTPVIKKVKKGGHGHHGGAWKVAYADFVTAMMAFFLLLWLLNSVTQEQLEGISNYFAPASVAPTSSGAGGVLGGQTLSDEGVELNRRAKPSVSLTLPPPKLGHGGEASAGQDTGSQKEPSEAEETAKGDVDAEQAAKERADALEQKQFEEAKKRFDELMESLPAFKRLAKSLLVDNTPEGLRIQLVDQKGLAMFPRGSADMYLHTRRLLEVVAKVIVNMPQRVAIAGHTDATRFVNSDEHQYTNWELSADRANAARRALVEFGVPEGRISRVLGKAATDPLIENDPTNPRNRRLSIVLLRKSLEDHDRATPLQAAENPTGG